MPYAVKEIFYTLRGEGAQTGRPAVFCRFAGCNLWTGREQDRADAVCRFCDTDFVGTDGPGGASSLARAPWQKRWRQRGRTRPAGLVGSSSAPVASRCWWIRRSWRALHAEGFEIAVETNGTQVPPPGIDWLTVSPKAGAALAIRQGTSSNWCIRRTGRRPARAVRGSRVPPLLPPADGRPRPETNTAAALRYCLSHPRWRLSLQTHKLLGIP